MNALRLLVSASLALAATLASTEALAAPKKVLFVTITGSYNPDGVNMFNELVRAVGGGNTALGTAPDLSAGAANTTHVTLSGGGGQVISALAADTYEQIWVYDLSSGTDNYPNDYNAIRDWYNALPVKEIICDGRWISSFWSGRYSNEGRKLTENYYTAFKTAGSGLLLATDHNAFSTRGINDINALIGLNGFSGNFPDQPFPLDQGHPLSTTPNILLSLFNNSTTGQAPFGAQPGGRTLQTLGYHSGNATTPGISTTISGGLLNFEVNINGPSGAICDSTNSYTTNITSSQNFGPYTYQWFLDPPGTAPSAAITGATSPNYTFNTSGLTSGVYILTVVASGAGGRADESYVTIEVGACECGGGAAEICAGDTGAVFAIPVDGPTPGLYALCRLMPSVGATPAYFDCLADATNTIDLVSSATLAGYFGVGFCAAAP